MGRIRLGWATADATAAERAIRDALGTAELANAALELVPPLAGDGPLEVVGRGAPGLGALPVPPPVVIGIGWATVDRERAAAELTDALPGILARGFVPVPRDPALGAHALVAAGPPGAGTEGDEGDEADGAPNGAADGAPGGVPAPRLVLLEPDTEGRLAGALARHGEGPIALYVARRDPGGARSARVAGAPADGPDGPFGPARLVPMPDRFGPFLVVLSGPERLPSAS